MSIRTFVMRIFLALFILFRMACVQGAELPAAAAHQLARGDFVDLLVEYESAAVDEETLSLRRPPARGAADVIAERVERYGVVRRNIDEALGLPDAQRLKDYSHLPMALRRFQTLSQARAFAARKDVKGLYEDIRLRSMLVQSMPLIEQPAVATAINAGAGTTIAVIDNGINYTLPAFGSCTAPGVPSGCKVVASLDFGAGTTDKSHGTNVSAIALGVAPASRIAMLNAFSGSTAWSSDIIAAINWAIANRDSYNIVAINMSLGESNFWIDAPCVANNVFLTPLTAARNAGMAVVASAGNEARKNGITKPACTPGAISVGAVYDANVGGLAWGGGLCADSTTAADKVACFSNSGNILTLLAPGALIAAAGISMGGTSQAAPHVTGAVAVLRSLYPGETLDQIQARLTTTGKPVTDAGNGISKPRLALLAAARPRNDAFGAATALSGLSGRVGGQTLLATKEAGEPNHAGAAGGRSVWWKWMAPAAGQMTLDTHGSNFDTLLAVYVGGTVGSLIRSASNDNDALTADGTSRVLFQAQSGIEYRIAIDGFDQETGAAVLNWNLNTSAQADVSLNITGSYVGPDTASYGIVVANLGPQTATGVRLTVSLPGNAHFLSASPECQLGGTQLVCLVADLSGGDTAMLSLLLKWTPGDSYQISASIQSDVADPRGTDNVQTVAVMPGESVDGDVPTLPEWGVILSLLLLGGLIARGRDVRVG